MQHEGSSKADEGQVGSSQKQFECGFGGLKDSLKGTWKGSLKGSSMSANSYQDKSTAHWQSYSNALTHADTYTVKQAPSTRPLSMSQMILTH